VGHHDLKVVQEPGLVKNSKKVVLNNIASRGVRLFNKARLQEMNFENEKLTPPKLPLFKGMRFGRDAVVPAIVFGCLALGIYFFLVIAGKVADGEIRNFDVSLLLFFRDASDPSRLIGPPWLPKRVVELSALGSTSVVILALVLVVGFLLTLRRYGPALFMFLSVALGWLISSALKQFYDRPRPNIVEHLDSASSASFPSGHAMMSTVIYLTMAVVVAHFYRETRVRVYVLFVAVLVPALVGITRIMLGVHWPSDVLAGWSLGVAWASFLWLVMRFLGHRQQ